MKTLDLYRVDLDGIFSSIELVNKQIGEEWGQVNSKDLNKYEYFTTLPKAKKHLIDSFKRQINDYKSSIDYIKNLKIN